MSEEFNLEDIEAHLYSQVYHTSAENVQPVSASDLGNVDVPIQASSDNIPKHHGRYFQKQQSASLPIFISFEEERNNNASDNVYTSVQNVTVSPTSTAITTDGNFSKSIQNNITVNHYSLPVLLNPEINELLNPRYGGKYLNKLSVRQQKLLEKKNRRRLKRIEERKKKRNRKIETAVNNTQVETNDSLKEQSEVIYITDDSDNECVIIQDTQIVNRKEDEKTEEDDDIIFVPPSPIEVINIDLECEENKIPAQDILEKNAVVTTTDSVLEITPISQQNVTNNACALKELKESLNTSESVSNDFLDNSIENNNQKFNFSLHGADFVNSQGDFVSPAKPVDFCETESSCSTNECNREFNNTVKTIVFDEIDFPKEEIFFEKNLESFGSFITPKRCAKQISSTNIVNSKKNTAVGNENVELFSSDSGSSSESDYESPSKTNTNKKCSSVINTTNKNTENVCCSSVTFDCSSESGYGAASELLNKNLSGNSALPTLSSVQSDNAISQKKEKIKDLVQFSGKLLNKRKSKVVECSESDTDKNIVELNTKKNLSKKKNPKKVKTTVACEEVSSIKPVDNNSTKPLRKKRESRTYENEEKNNLGQKKDNYDECKKTENSNNVGKVTKRKKRSSLETNCKLNDGSTAESDKPINSSFDLDNVNKRDENKLQSETVSSSSGLLENQTSLTCSKNDSDTVLRNLNENNGISSHNKNDAAALDKKSGTVLIAHTTGLDLSKPIVGDERSASIAEYEVVISSESECDLSELHDVGTDLELANCSVTPNCNNNIETVVVEDSSESNFAKNSSDVSFNVEHIQSNQSDDPENWKISYKDRVIHLKDRKQRSVRCNRCRHFGHIALKCTEKLDPPRCSLCGNSDHQEPRCPHKICFQCGNEGDYSTVFCWKCVKFRHCICRICNMEGHIAKACPDLWRRYHLTTEVGPIIVSQEPQLKPRDQQWCSGCAGQGHLEHECNYYNREYPPSNPCIVSYEDVLRQRNTKSLQQETFGTPLQTVQVPSIPSTSSQSSLPSFPLNNSFIPPLMSLNVLPQAQSSKTLIPSISSENFFIEMPNPVLNPFSVMPTNVFKEKSLDPKNINHLNNGLTDTNQIWQVPPQLFKGIVRDVTINDYKIIKQIIMSSPSSILKGFLKEQMIELEMTASQADPRYLKRILFRFDRISQSKKPLKANLIRENCFWVRLINMFIFGVHKFRDGKLHVNYLKKYISDPKEHNVDPNKRRSVLSSYNYIFGFEKHVNVNYYKIIFQLIQQCDAAKISKNVL